MYQRLKQLAVQEDRFINDLFIEGINYVLQKYDGKG